MKEAEADYEAAVKTAESHQDPDLLARFMMMRANYLEDKGYNGSLYFDAKINGKPLPTEQEMRAANTYLKNGLDTGCLVMNDDLPELTSRRIQLFFNAVNPRPAAHEPQDATDHAQDTAQLPTSRQESGTQPTDQAEKNVFRIVITDSAKHCPSPQKPATNRFGNS